VDSESERRGSTGPATRDPQPERRRGHSRAAGRFARSQPARAGSGSLRPGGDSEGCGADSESCRLRVAVWTLRWARIQPRAPPVLVHWQVPVSQPLAAAAGGTSQAGHLCERRAGGGGFQGGPGSGRHLWSSVRSARQVVVVCRGLGGHQVIRDPSEVTVTHLRGCGGQP
jgi:hypothetical protein